jgi:hypothetical protein
MNIVNNHKNITLFHHDFIHIDNIFLVEEIFIFGIFKDKKNAVTKNHIKAGGNKLKNSNISALPEVQAIRVVISQNGLHDHQELAHTTIIIANGTKIFASLDNENATADKTKAVVRLSATGDIKKAKNHIIQKIFLYVYQLRINLFFNSSKTHLSRITSI